MQMHLTHARKVIRAHTSIRMFLVAFVCMYIRSYACLACAHMRAHIKKEVYAKACIRVWECTPTSWPREQQHGQNNRENTRCINTWHVRPRAFKEPKHNVCSALCLHKISPRIHMLAHSRAKDRHMHTCTSAFGASQPPRCIPQGLGTQRKQAVCQLMYTIY
jgi:hypothetical protein